PFAETIGTALGSRLGNIDTDVGAQIARGFGYGVITQTAAHAASGGRIRWESIAADAFGNALGPSIGDKIAHSSQPEAPLATSVSEVGRRALPESYLWAWGQAAAGIAADELGPGTIAYPLPPEPPIIARDMQPEYVAARAGYRAATSLPDAEIVGERLIGG